MTVAPHHDTAAEKTEEHASLEQIPDQRRPHAATGTRRIVLLTVGWISVAIGIVGVFVPGLPTTSFVLIAAWCFYRSSESAHRWLIENRLLGPYIRDYLAGKGMPLRAKVITIAIIWLSCGTSAYFFIDPLWGKLGLLGAAVAGSISVAMIRPRRTATS